METKQNRHITTNKRNYDKKKALEHYAKKTYGEVKVIVPLVPTLDTRWR